MASTFYEKQPIRALGLTENEIFHASDPSESQKCLENRLSSADEMKKTTKTARRRPTKCRIIQFSPVVGRRNVESPVFCVSPPWGKSKSPIFCISQLWESKKYPKTAFPNFGKVKNTQKLCFRHGRRTEDAQRRVPQKRKS